MSGRIVFGFSLIGLSLAFAGCGGDGASTTTGATTITDTISTTTTTTAPETTKLRVYFLLDGKVQPVSREVAKTQAVARAALDELTSGPSTANRELGMTSDVSAGISGVTIANGVAKPQGVADTSRTALAQIVYTLTQFPTVKAVEIGGARYTRKDFEDETPIILVESPLPYEAVTSPIHATGTANTFEATFQYDVIGPDGKRLATHFVTATSGTGTRGTFDFTTKPFTAEGDGALVVYELSAKDGSRIHEVRIPLHFVAAK
jgi:immunoglobulin-like protein involved in spore germination/sporulation and spore germination protein